jgi:hypothetical protein
MIEASERAVVLYLVEGGLLLCFEGGGLGMSVLEGDVWVAKVVPDGLRVGQTLVEGLEGV